MTIPRQVLCTLWKAYYYASDETDTALHLMCQRDVQPKLLTGLGPLIQLHLKVR
jgi:hypothetical protein